MTAILKRVSRRHVTLNKVVTAGVCVFALMGCATQPLTTSSPTSASSSPASKPPKGYGILELTVTNPTGYEAYRQAVAPTISQAGGKYLMRGRQAEALEGALAKRMVVLEFPSYAAARAFYNSPAYQAIIGLRQANSTARIVVVEGMAP